ncbi:MAG: molecular chaperone DnaJ [Opitutaceae bacterium]|jgi:predicted Zn-dependent protease|nr:molecular chaperone DnaJ [Opitutaceae bacterium]
MPSRREQFEALAAAQPENQLFRFSLAQALEAEGRSGDAVEHYRFCVAAKIDWMMPRILLGKVLLRLGRRDEAGPVLREALALAAEQHHEDPERELRALLAELG